METVNHTGNIILHSVKDGFCNQSRKSTAAYITDIVATYYTLFLILFLRLSQISSRHRRESPNCPSAGRRMHAITTPSSPLFQTHHMSAHVALVILVTSLKLFFICFHLVFTFFQKLSGLPMCVILMNPCIPRTFFIFIFIKIFYLSFPCLIS